MAKNYKRKIILQFNYDEIKDGVSKVGAQMGILNKEYKAAQAQADAYGKSTDKLAVRQDYLKERIKIMNAELATHKERLEQAKATDNAKAIENYSKKVQMTEADLKALNADLAKVSGELEKQRTKLGLTADKWKELGEKTTDVGKKMSLGLTVPIVAAGTKAFQMASDFEQAQGKLEVVFQSSANDMKQWADTAIESMNISKLTATRTAADYGALFQGVGISLQQSAEWSKALTERVADLSNFYDTTTDETITALNSIVTGTVQPLRRFGITMTEANLQQYAFANGINKTVREMSESEKVQLRYNFVMDKTKMALGTTAREADSAGAQTKKFKETVTELGLKFGEVLLPMITPVIEVINKILTGLSKLDAGTRKTIVTFLGILAVAGPILIIAGKIATAISAITALKANLAAKTVTEGAKVGSAVTGMGGAFSFTYLKIMGAVLVLSVFIGLLAVLLGKGKDVQNTMTSIGNATSAMATNLQGTTNGLKNAKVKTYAIGTNYVDSDQLAYIHKGEAIIPAHQNPFGQDGFKGSIGGDTIILNVNMDEVSDVRKLVETVKRAKQTKRAGGELNYAL